MNKTRLIAAFGILYIIIITLIWNRAEAVEQCPIDQACAPVYSDEAKDLWHNQMVSEMASKPTQTNTTITVYREKEVPVEVHTVRSMPTDWLLEGYCGVNTNAKVHYSDEATDLTRSKDGGYGCGLRAGVNMKSGLDVFASINNDTYEGSGHGEHNNINWYGIGARYKGARAEVGRSFNLEDSGFKTGGKPGSIYYWEDAYNVENGTTLVLGYDHSITTGLSVHIDFTRQSWEYHQARHTEITTSLIGIGLTLTY